MVSGRRLRHTFLITVIYALGLSTAHAVPAKIPTFSVAIAPIGWILEQIEFQGSFKSYVVMKPGQHAHSFSPTPQQINEWSKVDFHFALGLPFEKKILRRLQAQNPKLKIIPLTPNAMAPSHGGHDDHGDHHDHDDDPHVWLDPMFVVNATARMSRVVISAVNPQARAIISNKAAKLTQALLAMDKTIQSMFKDSANKSFWVHHDAWGHFAKRYGLKQVAIESHGKEPSPKHLAKLIKQGRLSKVSTIFAQKGESASQTEFIAKELGAKVETIDPLDPNYAKNLDETAKKIKSALVK